MMVYQITPFSRHLCICENCQGPLRTHRNTCPICRLFFAFLCVLMLTIVESYLCYCYLGFPVLYINCRRGVKQMIKAYLWYLCPQLHIQLFTNAADDTTMKLYRWKIISESWEWIASFECRKCLTWGTEVVRPAFVWWIYMYINTSQPWTLSHFVENSIHPKCHISKHAIAHCQCLMLSIWIKKKQDWSSLSCS